jgi:hypothetical protein
MMLMMQCQCGEYKIGPSTESQIDTGASFNT